MVVPPPPPVKILPPELNHQHNSFNIDGSDLDDCGDGRYESIHMMAKRLRNQGNVTKAEARQIIKAAFAE